MEGLAAGQNVAGVHEALDEVALRARDPFPDGGEVLRLVELVHQGGAELKGGAAAQQQGRALLHLRENARDARGLLVFFAAVLDVHRHIVR